MGTPDRIIHLLDVLKKMEQSLILMELMHQAVLPVLNDDMFLRLEQRLTYQITILVG